MLQGVYLVYHLYPTILQKKLIIKFYQRMQQNHKNHNLLRNYEPRTSSASIWCDSKIIKGTLERYDIFYNKAKKT